MHTEGSTRCDLQTDQRRHRQAVHEDGREPELRQPDCLSDAAAIPLRGENHLLRRARRKVTTMKTRNFGLLVIVGALVVPAILAGCSEPKTHCQAEHAGANTFTANFTRTAGD